jgi:hypothetical protein
LSLFHRTLDEKWKRGDLSALECFCSTALFQAELWMFLCFQFSKTKIKRLTYRLFHRRYPPAHCLFCSAWMLDMNTLPLICEWPSHDDWWRSKCNQTLDCTVNCKLRQVWKALQNDGSALPIFPKQLLVERRAAAAAETAF